LVNLLLNQNEGLVSSFLSKEGLKTTQEKPTKGDETSKKEKERKESLKGFHC
jgi:hypothetical protein